MGWTTSSASSSNSDASVHCLSSTTTYEGASRRGMPPGQDDVDPLAAQRQLVLEQHLDLVEAGLQQVVGEHAQARVP